jgi:dTDP-4-amino-4,6-dideoxygalactose transaminase
MESEVSRRSFIGAAAAGATALAATEKPAMLGGKKVRTEGWPAWPVFDKKEEDALLSVLRSGKWYRGSGDSVARFEKEYAALTGAKGCLATANGTSALVTSLAAIGIGAGDEVIVPPYTFVATVNAVLLMNALPIFVDSERDTFQIDPKKIEAAITPRTAAIIPVHLGGSAADLDSILAIAAKHKVPVIEDACQAHLGEWRGKKVGTYGSTGCFSFQASKNLNSGEGGAILTNDENLLEKSYAFHNNSRGRKSTGYDFAYPSRGLNLRMTEFQAALLLSQMTRLEEQSKRRDRNGAYLSSMLREIPGIRPARMYDGCTRNAFHLYMFRYEQEKFANMPRTKFLKALAAEGIPASGGYSPLNKEPFLKNTVLSRGFERVFSKQRIAEWEKRNNCPENDRLCEEAVWLTQTMLIGEKSDMDQIAEAVRKIHAWAPDLAKS